MGAHGRHRDLRREWRMVGPRSPSEGGQVGSGHSNSGDHHFAVREKGVCRSHQVRYRVNSSPDHQTVSSAGFDWPQGARRRVGGARRQTHGRPHCRAGPDGALTPCTLGDLSGCETDSGSSLLVGDAQWRLDRPRPGAAFVPRQTSRPRSSHSASKSLSVLPTATTPSISLSLAIKCETGLLPFT